MKSRQGRSKPRRYKQVSKERKLWIAEYIVANPDVPIKQVAASHGISLMMCYRIIQEFLDIKKQYAFKRPTEPTE